MPALRSPETGQATLFGFRVWGLWVLGLGGHEVLGSFYKAKGSYRDCGSGGFYSRRVMRSWALQNRDWVLGNRAWALRAWV